MGESAYSVEQLVGLVYDAVVDTGAWQGLVDHINRHLDGAYVHLHAHDHVARSNVGMVCSGHSEDYIRTYLDHYSNINPLTPQLYKAPLGRVVRTEELIDPGKLARTEFYNDWFRPQEDCFKGFGTVLLRENGRMFFAGIHLPARNADHKADATQAVLNQLRPHMLRAMEMRRSLAAVPGGHGVYQATLDNIADAVFHLDSERRVVWMNRSAETLCRTLRRFRIDAAQKLHTGDSGIDGRIHDLCRGRSAHILPFVIDTRTETGSLLVGQVMSVIQLDNPLGVFEHDVSAVMVIHVAGRGRGWSSVVKHLGLTAAEAMLANDLVHGLTLDQSAAGRGTSIHTVRNQLRAILAKTGTSRQSELVGLLAPFARLDKSGDGNEA
ncbi:MAG: hypothetical protein ABS76_24680 [Pelagibacterium sp. SCN 64-44]|nr:MAG: hypothetical protein ABS76_24680 [Pelagibacterium sp. SCN 64-44]